MARTARLADSASESGQDLAGSVESPFGSCALEIRRRRLRIDTAERIARATALEIEFKRELLYEEVWATPLTQLARKYGLSDNGLRKVCQAMHIPLPRRGYWAKIAAGHPVARQALPTQATRTTFRSSPPDQPKQFHAPEDDAWLAQQLEFERAPENAIAVEVHPRSWHRIAAPLRDLIRQAEKDVTRWRELAEARSRTKGRQLTPDMESWKWNSFLREGQLLMHAPMRITPRGQQRALSIVNALCFAAEARGFGIDLNRDQTRITLDGHGAILAVRLTEHLKLEGRASKELATLLPANTQRMPTGILRIFLEGGRSEVKVADDQSLPLESSLNLFFERAWVQVVRYRQIMREREDWQRRWRLDEERRKADAERAANERRERETLVSESAVWQRSETIRQYVAHVTNVRAPSTSDGELTEAMVRWRSWALTVADELDPTAKRVAVLHGQITAGEPKATSASSELLRPSAVIFPID